MSTWKNKGKYTRKGKGALSTIPKNVRNRAYMKSYALAHKEENRVKSRERARALRREIIAGYGGVCVCCGESTYEFLTLDHVNGGGNEHRRQFSNNNALYKWIQKNSYPTILQILCSNCNSAKGYYGYCPHQKEKIDN